MWDFGGHSLQVSIRTLGESEGERSGGVSKMPSFLAAGDTWIEMSRQQVDVLELKGSDHRYRNLGVMV